MVEMDGIGMVEGKSEKTSTHQPGKVCCDEEGEWEKNSALGLLSFYSHKARAEKERKKERKKVREREREREKERERERERATG